MQVRLLDQDTDLEALFTKLGVCKGGVEIMKKKACTMFFYIKDLKCASANILKQDAISVGADLAVPSFVAGCERTITDAVLLGSRRHIEDLIKKEKKQPYCLKALAQALSEFIDTRTFPLKIMGILNLNEDSFYEKSRKSGLEAVERIEQMIAEGADIIDVGGVSSRPGSEWVDYEEEIRRIGFVAEEIYKNRLYEKAAFSIDTINPKVAAFALERGFSILNDIDGLSNEENAVVAAKNGAGVVIMHKKGDTKNMQQNPVYDDVVMEVDAFFTERIGRALKHGVKNIVLDVGIGFGKSLEHNLSLIKHHRHFTHFNYPLLLGISRKSMIDKLSPSSVHDRLAGTVALHLEGFKRGASIFRVHDVFAHVQAFKIAEALHRAD